MFFEFGGAAMHYEYTRGTGIPILFLHGWGGGTVSFKGLEEFFLSRGRPCINLDFFGHGMSSEPPAPYGVEDFADAVKSLIDKLLIDKVCIVAHSFGGRVAIKLAAKYPHLPDKMLLTGCAGLKPKRTLIYRSKVRRYKRAKRRGGDLSGFGSPDYQKLSEGMKKTFVKVVNEDLSGILTDIRCPVLLIFGSKDTETPMYMARRLRKGIADSALIVFEGAGHFAYLDEYIRFRLIAENFIRRQV